MNRRKTKSVPHTGMTEYRTVPSLDWLESSSRFSFYDGSFRVTMRKEIRRGVQKYWYGYAKFGNRTVKTYVGLSEDLTGSKLEATVLKLKRKAHEKKLV